MFNIGMPELIVVFIVALVAFGPKRLPKIGRQIGRAVRAFKQAARELQDAVEQDPSGDVPEELKDQVGKSEEEKAQSE